ncbi:hypothetical protein THAPSDRAFT_268204 [Thalassiosira pseudonana CCMP1335]|uniref:Uncharacterized protein n=1 Tax=Thalassiosira pseudonana TaxID=35128 RepID=B8BTS5_THAPS|nr:hypothetical protein THAPSDRAFT_268204 [Thalassiosira pseudonana CCMP1335]EED94649.1 hypothetical protein THAPSDRAFT_268204 [Thalassiosira pseudonana CCMP1335]
MALLVLLMNWRRTRKKPSVLPARQRMRSESRIPTMTSVFVSVETYELPKNDDDDSDDTPALRWKDDIEEEDFDQECVSSCDRLRFGPQKKEECIAKCASSFISPTATPAVVDGDDGSEYKERARDSYYLASVF